MSENTFNEARSFVSKWLFESRTRETRGMAWSSEHVYDAAQMADQFSDATRAELTRLREENAALETQCEDESLCTHNLILENEGLKDQLAEKDRRIAELEAHRCEVGLEDPNAMMAHLATLPAGDLRALNDDMQVRVDRRKNLKSTIAAQDAALVAMKEALDFSLFDPCKLCDPSVGVVCPGHAILTTTAPAAQEAERRIREAEAARIIALLESGETIHAEYDGRGVYGSELRVILGTQRAVSGANTEGEIKPA